VYVSAQAKPSQAAEVASSSGDSSSVQKTFHHGITYVSYEGNCFWVKFNNSGTHSNMHCNRAVAPPKQQCHICYASFYAATVFAGRVLAIV
jgi:hypothetical protein